MFARTDISLAYCRHARQINLRTIGRLRGVPAWLKRQAYAEYGITQYETGDYEVDHLIPLSLGGSNSIRNLWPQSTKTSPWNSYVKDALERKLHDIVCRLLLEKKKKNGATRR